MSQRVLSLEEYRAGALRTQSASHRASVRSGEDTEQHLASLNAQCVRERYAADLVKIPTPTAGKNRARFFTKRASVDFVGCTGLAFRGGAGRAIYAEAKRCTEARFLFGRVKPHQRAALSAVDAAGGVAVVLVVYGPTLLTSWVCAVPWSLCAEMIAAGEKSLDRVTLATWSIERGRPWLAASWLSRVQP